ncbi:hypothetical protein Ahy_A03g010460 isoform B [Arachis hypogaea]|uniref:Probable purine permease n=1 Tax=Arachis hypogaea TaxID=3818 RepID=A0A445DMN0_ARAHY|nr:hypothetical protein Ahy_A03g010460 isoform B [Arachis hypogaea]
MKAEEFWILLPISDWSNGEYGLVFGFNNLGVCSCSFIYLEGGVCNKEKNYAVNETKPVESNDLLNHIDQPMNGFPNHADQPMNGFLNNADQPTIKHQRSYRRWFLITLYSVFVLSGQAAATLLGRLYYDKGGNSKWMGSLVQVVGFPILLPYYCITTRKTPSRNSILPNPSASALALVYVSLGLLVALTSYLESLGLAHLPASTFALITSSRLAFNAFFSFFLNSVKFTPYLINSLVLLTLSPTLLAFQPENEISSGNSKHNYVLGFIASVAGSAAYGLLLSLTQLSFLKVLKRNTIRVLMDVIVYESLVATIVTLVGLFASGEGNKLHTEIEEYEMGKVSYLLTLSFSAICWNLFNIGCVGLIFETSSLLSNSIVVLGLPIIPILAVFVFHDIMHGIKAISLVLAVWGFLSYLYQYYLDDKSSNTDHILNTSTLEDINDQFGKA